VNDPFSIHIRCGQCNNEISCAISIEKPLPWIYQCSHCHKQFGIDSETIVRQIRLFIDLCKQLKASEEILSNASVGIMVGSTEVKIPFKLLLTRLRSILDLTIEGKKITISSRTEPISIAEKLSMKEPCDSTL